MTKKHYGTKYEDTRFHFGGCIILEIQDFFKMIMSNISRACQFV